MIYYTADLHFGCQNKFRERTLDIDDLIIKNWNQKISNGDTVYILGDVGKEGKSEMNEYLCRCLSVLKGRKILITGNHDKVQDLRIKQQFTEIYPYREIYDVVDKRSNKIVLFHYPILFWNGQHEGSIHLYGHLHDTEEEKVFQEQLRNVNDFPEKEGTKGRKDCPEAKAFNVGCMIWNYVPVSLQEIIDGGKSK